MNTLRLFLFSFLLSLISFSFGQKPSDPFEGMWKKVDSLNNQGLSRSAFEQVVAIHQKAVETGDQVQQLKAISHKLAIRQTFEEKADSLNIAELKGYIATAQTPGKQILQSMLADFYKTKYQRARYLIMDRTTVEVVPDDPETWDLKTFHQQISDLYFASLQPEDELRAEPVKKYEPILLKARESEKYRPTLYDLLAHRALDYFISAETGLTEHQDKFTLEGKRVFVDGEAFRNLGFETPDSLSKILQAAKIFQKLLGFHSPENPAPYVDVELKRLEFLKSHALGEDIDTLYMSSLQSLAEQFASNPVSAEVQYKIASLYNTRGNSYQPLVSDAYRWDKKKALGICEEVLKKFPDSYGAKYCEGLKNNILSPSLNLKLDEVNLPDRPFRVYANWENIPHLHYRIVPKPSSLEENYYQEKLVIELLLKETPIIMDRVSFPDEGDYQSHASEIKISGLAPGKYMILAANTQNYDLKEDLFTFAEITVSGLSYFSKNNSKGDLEIFITDRETGKPLKGVSIQKYIRDYGNNKPQKSGDPFFTDKNGYAKAPYKEERGYYELELSYKGDKLTTGRLYAYYVGDRTQIPVTRTWFFTDRKIYRPGQTVYFKAIVLQREGKDHTIRSNYPVTVKFHDVNGEVVSEQKLTTNDYGTVNGSFNAPSKGLLGQMSLRTEGGQHYFRVEEYKRPKFEVKFEDVAGDYKLEGTATTKGSAISYSGANLTGATVNYRVVRETRFPYWYGYFWRMPMPSSPAREITNGTITTGNDGTFEIEFDLIPDEDIKPSTKPIFTYTVYADVVDITGETHSAQTSVKAGYVGIEAGISVDDQLDREEKLSTSLSTKNLNGTFVPAEGTLTIYPLVHPDRVLRKRNWPQPDAHIIAKDDYLKDFPHDVYAGENNAVNWERGTAVVTLPFNTGQSKDISLAALANAPLGKYQIEMLTEDAAGQEIKVLKTFTLTATGAKKPVIPALLETSLDKTTAQPGETIYITIRTSEKKQKVVYEVILNSETIERRVVRVKAGKPARIAIPVKEAYRGGIGVSVVAVRHNEFHAETHSIDVPWTNKQLKLEWITFRDKLIPGQKEEWKLKITGSTQEAVAAELVATLYDASLDEFAENSFDLNLYSNNYSQYSWNGYNGFSQNSSRMFRDRRFASGYPAARSYDRFNWFGAVYGWGGWTIYPPLSGTFSAAPASGRAGGMELEDAANVAFEARELSYSKKDIQQAQTITVDSVDNDSDGVPDVVDSEPDDVSSTIPIRANLNETAFFFPAMETDENGAVILSFTMPEAMTRWKFLGLAHTKDLSVGKLDGETVTQKDLMVTPNVPRFVRVGDNISLSAKITNLSEKALDAKAELVLLDAFTREEIVGAGSQSASENVDTESQSASEKVGAGSQSAQEVKVEPGGNAAVSWDISIPKTVQALVVQVKARAGDFTDGEEHVIPVLENRLLVTESIPLAVRGEQTRQMEFSKLVHSDTSTTLQHQKLTLEFTSNPAWYAVQSLPYLMEFPHECTEQIYSRFYANALASHIATGSPRVQQVFEQWKNSAQGNEGAFLSNLEKNQDLKSVLLEETPWVLNARAESERKRRVGLLFDMNRMTSEMTATREQLFQRQLSNGAFSWFPGMQPSRYITQLIVTGMGHLQKLGVHSTAGNPEINQSVTQALSYLDGKIQEDYQWILAHSEDKTKDHLSSSQIQYMYARSFFSDIPLARGTEEAYQYFYQQGKTYWTKKSRYMQGMLALTFHRTESQSDAKKVLASLKENAVYNKDLGMYWKGNGGGYYWYEAPIEQHALMIEAFHEIAGDLESVEEMKVWLLKNKQTNDWKTTRATAAACNALLSTGADWLEQNEIVAVTLGKTAVNPFEREDTKVEAGTGYFKTSWTGKEIEANMGKVIVSKKDPGLAWGGLYWQYFEQMDKITWAATPLSLKKQLFKVENTPEGPKLVSLDDTRLKRGDKVRVRIELRVDRDMEYVHMKDLRAAAFEPTEVLSSYRYKSGLGYYQSTKDAATHFFFDRLYKGTHVFEYDLFATQKGDFSNGITTIQCMYAPEFNSHSEGIRVKID